MVQEWKLSKELMIHLISVLPSQPQLAGLMVQVAPAPGVPTLLGVSSPAPGSQHLSVHLTSAPYANGLQQVFLF